MAIKFIINSLEPDSVPKEQVLEDLVISVGKSQGCTVELEHELLSYRHFIIKYEEQGYVIVDEGSEQGTFLNDKLLEPGKSYNLSYSQMVSIPGFSIQIINDNQIPKAEKTTVVARKLMGKLFEDISANEATPFLLDLKKGSRYIFKTERSSFVMGRAHHLDFVVEDEHIKKEHLSFIRDISGVRAIIINDADLKINDSEIKNSVLLRHGDRVKIGLSDFLFFEHEDESMLNNEEVALLALEEEKREHTDDEAMPSPSPFSKKPHKKIIISHLDRIFATLFFIVVGGISWACIIVFNQ